MLFAAFDESSALDPVGTRHRAGIGITEETDAIAVICSEETGAISLAVGGRIERDLSVEQLRDRLGSELRRRIIPVTLPTPIARKMDDESDAALDSPLAEPARKQDDSGPNREVTHDGIRQTIRVSQFRPESDFPAFGDGIVVHDFAGRAAGRNRGAVADRISKCASKSGNQLGFGAGGVDPRARARSA